MEQHRARSPQQSPPRTGRPAAGQDARLPRPAEAVPPNAPGARDARDALNAAGTPGAPRAPGAPGAPRGPGAGGLGAESTTVYRVRARRRGPLAPLGAAVERLPAPRLTGLGCGLLGTLALFAFAFFDRLLFDSAPTPYGVFFVLVSVCAGLWVRPYDLITAPVALPIAYTVGTVPISHDTGGFGGLLMGVFTVLATQAGWLYAGTLACALIVFVRKAAALARRQAERHAERKAEQHAARHGERQAERQAARAAGRRPAAGKSAGSAPAAGATPERGRGRGEQGPGPGQRPGLAQGARRPSRTPGQAAGQRAGQVRDRPASRPAT
ncbi:DUF6542 domain-containing protein [Streptomyces sp. NPDC052496]|uniref:DUF6542 domain-containing protein n=1 Tax=Streptomyces sp. NPDC052496 TaxID=3154951 RepID=UPI00341F1949